MSVFFSLERSFHIIEEQVQGYVKKKQSVIRALDQLKDAAIQMKNAVLQGGLNDFGKLLHYAWEYKKKMASKITAPFIDEMYEIARKKDAHLDGVYYCPHHPIEEIGRYKEDCWCREPNPGMLEKAAKDFDLDLSKSYVIGDQLTNIKLGNNAGYETVLVLTGYGKESYRKKGNSEVRVSFVADDLERAVLWILDKEKH